jgi:hypothetical protein
LNIAISTSLPALIDRAAKSLSSARTSAEILDARAEADAVYDMARSAARLVRAKSAHDSLLATAYRAQGDALEIIATAGLRLADEYDAAQKRQEVPGHGGKRGNQHTGGKIEDSNLGGITGTDIHEARIIRNAERIDPGIVKRTVDAALAAGEEPTKAKIKRAVIDAVKSAAPPEPQKKAKKRQSASGQYSAKETASRQRGAFILRAEDAASFAFYEGNVDADMIVSAKATALAWCSLVEKMESIYAKG